MMHASTIRCVGVVAVCCGLLTPPLAAEDRWVARWKQGELATANDIQGWQEPTSQPTVAGRSLVDPANPVTMLLDRQSQPVDPTSYVEFVGGDRLVGEVVEYRAKAASPYEHAPPHLLVQHVADVHPPDQGSAVPVRVTLPWLRRIVWSPVAGGRYVPATAWMSGGGRIAFRSLRWSDTGLSLLTESGLRSLEWTELAELHLPVRDPWEAYAEQLGTLTPKLDALLWRVETADGSRLTTSRERFEARHWGDRNKSESWLQLVAPAWSLDTLWLRFPTIRAWTTFDAVEPPLSWADPTEVVTEPVFGGGWPWRSDRNTHHSRLAIADQLSVHGFGVHGSTTLRFQLPEYVRAVRTGGGLDRRAGTGGSVRLSVVRDQTTTLYASDPLIGSSQRIDTGWLELPPSNPTESTQGPSLALRSDMLLDGAPAGADPFDIRDIVAWVEPQIRLDREGLAREVARQAPAAESLAGWSLPARSADGLLTRNWLDETDHRSPHFRTLWSTSQPWITLSRTQKVTADDRWLTLMIERFEKSSQPMLVQLKLDGRVAGEFEIPLRQGPIDPYPISVPLEPGSARQVQVQVTMFHPQPDSWWTLRGVVTGAELPGIRWLYADGTPAWLADVVGKPWEVSAKEVFAGTTALRMESGVGDVSQIEDWAHALVDWPRLGEYRFLTFAWKGVDTTTMGLSLAHDGNLRDAIAEGLGLNVRPRGRAGRRGGRTEERGLRHRFTYAAGRGNLDRFDPLRVKNELPTAWSWESRDVVNDFGPLTLTGLGFIVRGGRGMLDAIALARTPQDVEDLRKRFSPPDQPSGDAQHEFLAWRREDWNVGIRRFAPQFSTPEARHGIHLKREHQGQAGAWQTHPNDGQNPFLLRTVHEFPANRPQELDVVVSHYPQHDWLLVVRVDGQPIFERKIDEALTLPQRGFASLQVDLSAYQGQTVLVEVGNAALDGGQEHAYWKRVELRDRP